ncbi:MAG: hypothetical protein HWE25_03665 [Alphaproteobacteria bacterium]|nr:hypothetical protein [Alphaproteobacteria bacterium]
MLFRLTLIYILCVVCSAARAEHFKLGIPSDDLDYFGPQIAVIKIALEHARGDHTLEKVVFDTPTLRAIRDLETGATDFDMFIAGYDPDKEKRFRQLYVPLTRGLLGMRVFAIKRENQPLFTGLDTLRQLSGKISVTSANAWTDTRILQAAGFKVHTAETENLWSMLANNRVEAFPRAVHEIATEIQFARDQFSDHDLVPEQSLLLVYPFDYFLYLRKADTRRQIILQTGFTNAYRSGALDRHFQSLLDRLENTDQLGLKSRKVIELPVADLSLAMKKIPEHYWLKLD